MMGHLNDDYIRLTAKNIGVEITGTLKTCEPCAVGKSKQKSVPKEDTRFVTVPGELLYMDIAGVHEPGKGGMKYWILFVYTLSGCSISRFAKQKRRSEDIGLEVLQDLVFKSKPYAVIMPERTKFWRDIAERRA
jgi:hypothetical protein